MSYTADPFAYSRRRTRVVMVGDVAVGGDNPIRVQSMTTTLTKNVEATADQAERLVGAGCEIVRITTPTPEDSRCLGEVRAILDRRGVHVPLVADIHFSPMAAMVAADHADKVRVNPGNYVDSRHFRVREYTNQQYEEEVERAGERFTPLVLKCKEVGRAIRIGTNHGSLSDRIMNRFGDTPEGMVESALEFVHVCESHGFYDIILSMKASNPKVMIAAYRLLAARMNNLGMEYPFHLGVTEAGNAEDGRIKSAIGIGSLLEDGIGDTIRVSLTEEPEEEIPVAFAIANRYPTTIQATGTVHQASVPTLAWDPFHYARRATKQVPIDEFAVGGAGTIAVACGVDGALSEIKAFPSLLRWASPAGRRQPKPELGQVELFGSEDVAQLTDISTKIRQFPMAQLALVASAHNPELLTDAAGAAAVVALCVTPEESLDVAALSRLAARTAVRSTSIAVVGLVPSASHLRATVHAAIEVRNVLSGLGAQTILSLRAPETVAIYGYRLLAQTCAEFGIEDPILLQAEAGEDTAGIDRLLCPSIILGSLLCDGIGDMVGVHGGGDLVSLAFNILQASGARISKTDYVACPSCGRTLFDLQETTERIKTRTSHLVGVKLAIMGCIVNGPGEMADADFGYVGGAPGKVNLYVGKECVEKGVPAEIADDRLIELIKSQGKWQEEEEEEPASPTVVLSPA
jgi:(E)-4-hydroxy-3-methylbut-2-enyl-diphosphate synthase